MTPYYLILSLATSTASLDARRHAVRDAIVADHIEWLDEDPSNGTHAERVLLGVETCSSDADCENVWGVAW